MSEDTTTSSRHTCLKLDLVGEDPNSKDAVFVKGAWFTSHFQLSITDGLLSWSCQASEAEVAKRALQWDQSVEECIEMAERYLGFQQPGSVYRFEDSENGSRRLSFTFIKQGVTLEWRWKCQPSTNHKQVTVEILDFLMDANIRLSEEVVRKTRSCEKLQEEAHKCLNQSERFVKEKEEIEKAAFPKFVSLLNSKKAMLRELRDRISKLENSGKQTDEEGSSDKTEIFDKEIKSEESDDADNHPGTKHVDSSSSKRQKRKLQC